MHGKWALHIMGLELTGPARQHHDAPIPRAHSRAEEGAVGHRAAHRGPGEGHFGRR